jgi:hypothetical protein
LRLSSRANLKQMAIYHSSSKRECTSEYSNKIVQGRYNLSYLMYFIKASHLCDNLNILLSNDKPLILEYAVADLGIMRFLLMGSIID